MRGKILYLFQRKDSIMAVGTQARPIESSEPMKIAEAVLRYSFQTPNRKRGLWFHQGTYYHWYGNEWIIRNDEWIEDFLWRELEDCYFEEIRDGNPIVRRLSPNRQKIENVMRALKAKVRFQKVSTPAWIDRKGMPEATECIAFNDLIFDSRTGKTFERDETWFDHVVLPCEFNPEAGCPTWHRCLDQWSKDDETWKTLLQMYMGYCLLHHRKRAKWLLMHGKVRSGKGTIAKVLQSLLGQETFKSTSLDDIAGDFGLDGLQTCRVLLISEVSRLDTKSSERAVRVLKQIIGQDPISINIKFQRQLQNIVVNAAPIVQANEIPELPNKGRGLSSKMLILPFDISFEGREDPYLINKLMAELPGIAQWCIEGAKLVTQGDKFVMPESASDAVEMYHLQNNPFDHFLEERFVKNPDGFVSTEYIWENWNDWIKCNHIRNVLIPRNQLVYKIQGESSWDLSRFRQGGGGKRGLKGLSIRKIYKEII